MLGEILAHLDQQPDLLHALLRDDTPLMTRLHAAGARQNHDPMALAARYCVGFTQDAPPDDWLKLMGVLQQSSDPTRDALRFMITRGLDRTDMDRTDLDRTDVDRTDLDQAAMPPA